MLTFDKTTAALIVIDLQEGILDPEPLSFGKEQVVTRATELGIAFADAKAPIVLTITDFAPGYADAPQGVADSPWALPEEGLPAGFTTLVPEIRYASHGRPHHQAADECLLRDRTRPSASATRVQDGRDLRGRDQPRR